MAYKPSGFPPGRPRNGEIRPLTPSVIAGRKHLEKIRKDPVAYADYLQRKREANRKYYAENAVFVREGQKASKRRKDLFAQHKTNTVYTF